MLDIFEGLQGHTTLLYITSCINLSSREPEDDPMRFTWTVNIIHPLLYLHNLLEFSLRTSDQVFPSETLRSMGRAWPSLERLTFTQNYWPPLMNLQSSV